MYCCLDVSIIAAFCFETLCNVMFVTNNHDERIQSWTYIAEVVILSQNRRSYFHRAITCILWVSNFIIFGGFVVFDLFLIPNYGDFTESS